jgi:hypothetical protein
VVVQIKAMLFPARGSSGGTEGTLLGAVLFPLFFSIVTGNIHKEKKTCGRKNKEKSLPSTGISRNYLSDRTFRWIVDLHEEKGFINHTENEIY